MLKNTLLSHKLTQGQTRLLDYLYQPTDGRQFTLPNLDQQYVLFSSAHKTTHRDMTSTVLKATLKPKITN